MILEKDGLPMIARWLIELSCEHHSIVGEVEVGFFIKNFLDGEINWIASLSWICHLDRRQLSASCDARLDHTSRCFHLSQNVTFGHGLACKMGI